MNKLKTIFKTHWISIVGASIVIFILLIGYLGCQTNELQQTVDNQTNQANKAVREAANHNNAAVNASIERRSEDAYREKVITPKLEQTRRKSQNSKAEIEKAEKEFQNAKTNRSNLNRSIADNCAELSRLYPDTTFQYCQP